MCNEIKYEWDFETVEDGETMDHHHEDDLSSFGTLQDNEVIALVRNEGNENGGVTCRFWAYVEDGKLPEYFTNEMGEPVNIKVPQRFHKELYIYLSK